jgi:hypothetical protein
MRFYTIKSFPRDFVLESGTTPRCDLAITGTAVVLCSISGELRTHSTPTDLDTPAT